MIRGLSPSPSVLGSIERIRSAVQHEEYEIRFFATKYIKKISWKLLKLQMNSTIQTVSGVKSLLAVAVP